MHADLPGRRPFYKYSDPKTVLTILRNQTVRYSSPLTFNDPFDFQSGLHFDFDLDSLSERVLDRLGELAAAPNEPTVDLAQPFGELVLEVRKYFLTHGFPRDRWRPLFESAFRPLMNEFEELRTQYQEDWTSSLPAVRVFCVSEQRDNLLMWAHYAKDHRGAVFEFWSLPEEDNPLSVARAVNYVKEPPPFFSENEHVEDILTLKKLNFDDLSRRHVYSKSEHWEYEREWRVWYPLATTEMHDYVTVRENEFAAIYIGCRATEEFRADVRDIVSTKYKKTRIFQANKENTAYKLEYSAV